MSVDTRSPRSDREWFEQALELEPEQRAAFVEHCADASQRERVWRLLRARAELDTGRPFLSTPAVPQTLPVVGGYELLELLGAGGMGEVYLAEQREPLRRRVALKLLRRQLVSPAGMARFADERRALERLEHPCIARLLDAGQDDGGRPFVAVEYVPGTSFVAHCDEVALSLDARLALFLQVCAGVAHAHQRGLIHRDLKPSNVLVTHVDGRPVPKIIDFGIARILEPLDTGGGHTLAGQVVGTPDYMSPEQVDGPTVDIDTRADVFALGAMLSQLVSGELPYPRIQADSGIAAVVRAIGSREPARPSDLLARDPARLAAVGRARGLGARLLLRRLRDDLDWIVLRATARDREERYASVADLAADLERYLAQRPVAARSHTGVYVVRRFVRRHRTGVGVAVVACIGAVAFTAVLVLQARELARERDRAAAEAFTAREVSRFLVGTLESADPEQHRGHPPSARQLLDAAAARLDGALGVRADAKAELESALGGVYYKLGEYRVALHHFERAVALHASRSPPDRRARLRAHRDVGRALAQLGQLDSAERITIGVLEEARGLPQPDESLVTDVTHDLASLRQKQGRLREATRLFEQVAETRARRLGPADPATLTARTNLAVMHQLLGDDAAAERTYVDVIRAIADTHPDEPQLLVARLNLSTLYSSRTDYERALLQQREIVPRFDRVYGRDHRYALTAAANLGGTLSNLGRHEEAAALNRELAERLERRYGRDHPQTLFVRTNLAYDRVQLGEAAPPIDAELRDILSRQRSSLGSGHPDVLGTYVTQALLRRRDARHREAIATLEAALDVAREALGPAHRRTGEVLVLLADSAYALGDARRARAWLDESRRTTFTLDGSLRLYPEVAARRVRGESR